MAQIIAKYPFDPTGINPTNLVSNVTISLPRVNNRAFSPESGPFYADSFELWHIATGTKLIPNVDYKILVMQEEATRVTNKLVTSLIYVTNTAYSEGFRYSLQTVGGEYTTNANAIQQMIDALLLDGRSIAWDDILDKPVLFPPAPHLHDVVDWYGMEQVVSSITGLTEALVSGDQVLQQQVLALLSTIQQVTNDSAARITQLNLTIGSLADRIAILEGKHG